MAKPETDGPAPEWDTIHGLRGSNFGEMAEEALSLVRTIKELESSLSEVKAKIQEELKRSQQKTVRAGELRITLAEGKKASRELDETLLLKNGVKMSVIEQSYVKGKPGQPYLVLTTKVDEV